MLPILVITLLTLAASAAWFLLKRPGVAETNDGHEGMHYRRIGEGLKRLEDMMRTYASTSRTLLEETPDDNLLSAVLAALWARMRHDLSDAVQVVAEQTQARQLVYALYATVGTARQEGLAALKSGPEASFLPMALDALSTLSMPESHNLLSRAAVEEDADLYNQPFWETFEGEGGKARMVAYIRAHPEGFVDEA